MWMEHKPINNLHFLDTRIYLKLSYQNKTMNNKVNNLKHGNLLLYTLKLKLQHSILKIIRKSQLQILIKGDAGIIINSIKT